MEEPMIGRDEALEYHAGRRPGKIEVTATTACLGPREMRLAYLPGALHPALEIAADPALATRYTARGNLVAVVSNGTAVPGLGAIGPVAAKPVQEGIAILLKRLADLDVFDLELGTEDPDRIVDTVRLLEPTFGAIDLRDVRAPEGIAAYERLRAELAIPVLHDDLQGPAVVVGAALLNAVELADKELGSLRVVVVGAGTVGLGCARLLADLGVPREAISLYDVDGPVTRDRAGLDEYRLAFASAPPAPPLAAAVRGADVLIGASATGVFSADMVRALAPRPLVVALAFLDPEIEYDDARAVRRDVMVMTSRLRRPNGVSGLLSVPYLLRGALDVGAAKISDGMLVAATRALSGLAREEVIEEVSRAYGGESFAFGPEYLVPRAVDPRTLDRVSTAVAAAAIAEGLAARPVEPEDYRERLVSRLGADREVMRGLLLQARRHAPRIVFPEGTADVVLRACSITVDEGLGRPVLLGNRERVVGAAEHLGLELHGVEIVDPELDPRGESYAEAYFRRRGRHGVTPEMARQRARDPRYFGALMLDRGDADLMVSGASAPYAESIRPVLEIIGPAPGVHRIASQYLLLRPGEVTFLADCAVNIEPDAEGLAEIALLSAGMARSVGVEPRVAMLSFSNFGSVDHPLTRKVRRAVDLVRQREPGLVIDGEMQPLPALDGEMRQRYFPFSELGGDANVLIFPDLQSGNLAMHLMTTLGERVVVGPVLLGVRRPVHLLQYGSSVREVVDLAAVATVYAAAMGQLPPVGGTSPSKP
jgi:malate dehydrogenase (oxaloacetate-decarboxylating)(NADP+)